ncbi:MAG: heparin lyase I family protein, partial [Pseudomonadota bacterium]
KRRDFIGALAAAGTIALLPVRGLAEVLKTRPRKVDISVGNYKKVRFGNEYGWAFTLKNGDGRETEIKAEANGRQRIELRDAKLKGQGTLRYTMDFMMPALDDPDGRLEAKFIFFQIKPDRIRNVGVIPYVSIRIPKNYRSDGFVVDFDFTDRNDYRRTNKKVRPGHWHRLEVTVKWVKDASGYAVVKMDGQTLAQHKGYTGPDAGPQAMPQFGVYRSHMNRTNPSKVEDILFYIKNYKVERLG